MIDSYDRLYKGDNFHRIWEGEISLRYKVPKYASLFADRFKNYDNLSILELGAGEGYLTKLIMEKLKYKKYVATEISDEGVKRLKEKGIEPTIVEYLKNPPGLRELDKLLSLLRIPPLDMLRAKEPLFEKLKLADGTKSRKDILRIVSENPVLLQRPIVVHGHKAVIARPPENVKVLF